MQNSSFYCEAAKSEEKLETHVTRGLSGRESEYVPARGSRDTEEEWEVDKTYPSFAHTLDTLLRLPVHNDDGGMPLDEEAIAVAMPCISQKQLRDEVAKDIVLKKHEGVS